jgi:glycine/D-amino acid oxidase-like deaminating enzyme
VTTYTASGYPYIGNIHGEQVFVAAGGCGRSAKSSDALGRLIAERVLHHESTLPLDTSVFKPRFAT